MEIKTINIEDSTFIYYSNSKQHKKHILLSDEIQDIGYIQFSIHDDEVIISYIYINPEKRGKGLAENLFIKMFSYCIEVMKSNHVYLFDILLDDMSDRYGLDNNLYLKMGFTYNEIDSIGPCSPEMTKTIRI